MENGIGEKIRAEREKRKMSQKSLAELLEISPQAVFEYEKGTRKPKLEKLIRISAALNVPVELFLPDELNKNEMVRKIKEEYDRGYQAGREAMKREIMEHMQVWLNKKEGSSEDGSRVAEEKRDGHLPEQQKGERSV